MTVQSLETRALSAEKRLKHMTSLLSESESEAARLTQMTDLLKEEIRSYQRSEERKKHIENLEYVKNIILKVRFPDIILLNLYRYVHGSLSNLCSSSSSL